MLGDAESSADIIFKTTFEWIEIYLSKIIESPSPLFRLSGETSMALGTINLLKHTYKSVTFTEFVEIVRERFHMFTTREIPLSTAG